MRKENDERIKLYEYKVNKYKKIENDNDKHLKKSLEEQRTQINEIYCIEKSIKDEQIRDLKETNKNLLKTIEQIRNDERDYSQKQLVEYKNEIEKEKEYLRNENKEIR